MSAARPVAVCALLALAVHAALLLRGHAQPATGPAARAPGVAVRLARETPPVVAATTPASPESRADGGPLAASNAEGSSAPGDPPEFEAAPPEIGFPDAELPGPGVLLRAFVQVDAAGTPQQVSTASPPGLAAPPPGFQKVTEVGLRQAQFKPAAGSALPTDYCLLVRFEPGAAAARLAWLPGAARDAARCLAGPMPRPRELPAG